MSLHKSEKMLRNGTQRADFVAFLKNESLGQCIRLCKPWNKRLRTHPCGKCCREYKTQRNKKSGKGSLLSRAKTHLFFALFRQHIQGNMQVESCAYKRSQRDPQYNKVFHYSFFLHGCRSCSLKYQRPQVWTTRMERGCRTKRRPFSNTQDHRALPSILYPTHP